ncbi:MAG: DUF6015 family protein [Candidatus Saliniplasma sp.]
MAEDEVNENGLSTALTIEQLTGAIQNSVDGRTMQKSAAKMMAEHVLNFFGYSERIIDNILEQEDRDVFYMLEDAGLLTTEREETTLYDGREWRIHYWLFRREKIRELIERQKESESQGEKEQSVYDDIPDGVWSSRMETES